MIYTTHGLMTAGDVAEIRRDMDLDLCGCCEEGPGSRPLRLDESGECETCGHEPDAHA